MPKLKNYNNISKYSNYNGFTLVELLIVIVIIGILAGILISVIDPVRQQNRARDASTIAALNKAALSVESFISAYNIAPNPIDFYTSLKNASTSTACNSTDSGCSYELTNILLPGNCSSVYYGSGTSPCSFNYTIHSSSPAVYTLNAKSYGADKKFVYNSVYGKIYLCSATAATTSISGCTPY